MKTHKEKSKELVEKYEKIELLKDFNGMDRQLAIECAKIAVDEIIRFIILFKFTNKREAKLFWTSVRIELNKMS